GRPGSSRRVPGVRPACSRGLPSYRPTGRYVTYNVVTPLGNSLPEWLADLVRGAETVGGGDDPAHQVQQDLLLPRLKRGEEDLVHARCAAGGLAVQDGAVVGQPQ